MTRAKLSSRLFAPNPVAEVFPTPQVIPFESARLCLDCEIICGESRCPKCAGSSLYPIAAWLKSVPQPALRIERRRSERRLAQDPNYRGPERRQNDRRGTAVMKNGRAHRH